MRHLNKFCDCEIVCEKNSSLDLLHNNKNNKQTKKDPIMNIFLLFQIISVCEKRKKKDIHNLNILKFLINFARQFNF